MLTHILVPLDGSPRAEQALVLARRLCHQSQARLSLISVIDVHDRILPVEYAAVPIAREAVLQERERHMRSYQEQVMDRYEIAELAPACLVQRGEIVQTILDVSQQQQCDLIIIVSHGKAEVRPEHLGKIAQQLVHKSPIPLLVMKGGERVPETAFPDKRRPLHYIEIVVALDGSEQAEQAILPAAHLVATIAAPTKGVVHLVQVVPPRPQPGEGSDTYQEQLNYTRMYHRAVHYIEEQVKALHELEAEGLNIMATCSLYAAQDIPSALKYFAEERQGMIAGGSDLLAMYTRSRPSRDKTPHANVTEEVLSMTSHPLLII
jgi:Universal stress protein UspA and related nucleotide-binding proteins